MLTQGTRLGVYEIAGPLGAGGMGVVYRARDTRLHRDVALKILPDAFATDADRRARFEREAHTLASLNHPHIAQIYGFEDATTAGAPVRALVMELVDGDDLAQRIARGVIPIEEAVPIARQVAEALEAAHEQGIIHRDLKPANIKVRADGTVKVLDFGLAKANARGKGAGADPAGPGFSPVVDPTLTSPATMQGMILGTASYMSPEQARGKPVDKRADIWAFGVVLYEMLTGTRAFAGDTVSDTIAAVLTKSPDLFRLPADTPPRLRRLLRRCLDRDPSHRLRDIGEARITLSGPLPATSDAAPGELVPQPSIAVTRRASLRAVVPWMALSAASIALAVYAFARGPAAVSETSFELAIASPPGAPFHIGSNSGNVIVSPDGTKVAFVAAAGPSPRLWVRSLDRDDARPLSGTEGALYPFWAPDSRQLGFFANGKVRTVTLDAGLPTVIADALLGRGGTWTEDGTIIFTPIGGGTLSRVPAGGGRVDSLTQLDQRRGENAHYWPHALPGSIDFLYFVRSTIPENNGIYLGHLDGRPSTRLISSLSSGIYAPPRAAGLGPLLWGQDDKLLAQSLNIANATLEGPVATIATGVRVEESQRGVFASVSANGVLAWAEARAANLVLTLLDRGGRRIKTLPIDAGRLMQPEISPDLTKVGFTSTARGTADVWIHDLVSGATARVSNSPDFNEQFTWSPDGKWVAYYGRFEGKPAFFVAPSDGSEASRAVGIGIAPGKPVFTADSDALIFTVPREPQGLSLVIAPLAANAAPITMPLDENSLAGSPVWMSPDRRWAALNGMTGTTPEVRVIRLLQEGGAWKVGGQRMTVATNAFAPQWVREGRELVYQSTDGHLMSVSVTSTNGALAFGTPTRLFLLPADDTGGSGNSWDMSADGTRVVIAEAPHAAGQTLRVLTNWQRRLRQSGS